MREFHFGSDGGRFTFSAKREEEKRKKKEKIEQTKLTETKEKTRQETLTFVDIQQRAQHLSHVDTNCGERVRTVALNDSLCKLWPVLSKIQEVLEG